MVEIITEMGLISMKGKKQKIENIDRQAQRNQKRFPMCWVKRKYAQVSMRIMKYVEKQVTICHKKQKGDR